MALAPSITINLPGYPFENFPSVATVSDLRALASAEFSTGDNYVVDGGAAEGDGGGGVFAWNDASTASDDGATVIKPNDTSSGQAGRWILTGSDYTQDQIEQVLADLASSNGVSKVGNAVQYRTSRANLAAASTTPNVAILTGTSGGRFVWDSSNLSAQVTADPQQGLYIPPTGGNGSTGAWVRQFDGTALMVPWFGSDASIATQAAISLAQYLNYRVVQFGFGTFEFDTTVSIGTEGIALVGLMETSQQAGTTTIGCKLVWTGGADPMFDITATRITMKGFMVDNEGTATSFLELNSGAQAIDLSDIYFPAQTTAFSEAVVKSNGNRAGYSKFSRIVANSPAPKFLFVDGQATPNSITPIEFNERCIFTSTTSVMTVLHIKDETIEEVSMANCTFIQDGYELIIVDTTDSPVSTEINVLNFSHNEIDSDTSGGADNSAYRFFKLENVESILFNGNKMNCGGTKAYAADLINSHVTDCTGNYYNSVGTALFNADADSTVRHGKQGFNQRPVFTTVTAGIRRPTYGASIAIDGRTMDPRKHEIIEVMVTDGAGYTISIDTSSPEWMSIGQVFTVCIRNDRGGGASISAGTFQTATFALSASTVAPADGYRRSYTFMWDGTKAREIARTTADVAN